MNMILSQSIRINVFLQKKHVKKRELGYALQKDDGCGRGSRRKRSLYEGEVKYKANLAVARRNVT